MSRDDAARDFLACYLPKDLTRHLDLNSLEIMKDSFVDQDLNEHFSDLLYRVLLKDQTQIYVYLLFEHKSYPEPLICLQLLRYMVNIWEQGIKQRTGTLPCIIPVVVYHGRVKWKIPLDFKSLISSPDEMKQFLPDFRYLLCNLTAYSDDEIKGTATLRVAFLLLKYIFSGDLPERLPRILLLLRELSEKRSGLEYLETVLRYLVHVTDKISTEELKKAVDKTLPQTGGIIMPTIAETWLQEGIQQGIQQGIQ